MDEIAYTVRVSHKARRMRISVGMDSTVVVTIPWGFRQVSAERFVQEKKNWILKSINYFQKFKGRVVIKSSRREYLARKTEAYNLVRNKILELNKIYGFAHGRVSIRNQKTRWGSCSKKGNLNFNYKVVHLSDKLLTYLVAHELSHIKEMNHSKNFWALVGMAVPEYKNLRRELRNFGSSTPV